jgi:ATP-dependent RNA/DNA helicase IGHMBP2
VISMVRSNARHEVGFLAEERRMNVAITRARRLVAVVADSETINHNPFLRRLVAYLEEHAENMNARQFLEEDEIVYEASSGMGTGKGQGDKVDGKNRRKGKEVDANQRQRQQQQQKEELATLSEAEKQKMKEEIEARIDGFVRDGSSRELEFEASLGAFQRKLVHEVAESLRLVHESRGEGTERRIIVWKRKGTVAGSTEVNEPEPETKFEVQEKTEPEGAKDKEVKVGEPEEEGQSQVEAKEDKQAETKQKGSEDKAPVAPQTQQKAAAKKKGKQKQTNKKKKDNVGAAKTDRKNDAPNATSNKQADELAKLRQEKHKQYAQQQKPPAKANTASGSKKEPSKVLTQDQLSALPEEELLSKTDSYVLSNLLLNMLIY